MYVYGQMCIYIYICVYIHECAAAGYVTIAFAEEKWAEREATFAQQVAQLKAMVAAQGEGGSAASEASQSVASDLGTMDDLEDDEAWSKVPTGRRKAFLRKERDALASKIRTSLGTVSTVSSPFLKKVAA